MNRFALSAILASSLLIPSFNAQAGGWGSPHRSHYGHGQAAIPVYAPGYIAPTVWVPVAAYPYGRPSLYGYATSRNSVMAYPEIRVPRDEDSVDRDRDVQVNIDIDFNVEPAVAVDQTTSPRANEVRIERSRIPSETDRLPSLPPAYRVTGRRALALATARLGNAPIVAVSPADASVLAGRKMNPQLGIGYYLAVAEVPAGTNPEVTFHEEGSTLSLVTLGPPSDQGLATKIPVLVSLTEMPAVVRYSVTEPSPAPIQPIPFDDQSVLPIVPELHESALNHLRNAKVQAIPIDMADAEKLNREVKGQAGIPYLVWVQKPVDRSKPITYEMNDSTLVLSYTRSTEAAAPKETAAVVLTNVRPTAISFVVKQEQTTLESPLKIKFPPQ